MSPKFTLRRSMAATPADADQTEARTSTTQRVSDVADPSMAAEKPARKNRRSNLLNRFSFRGEAPTSIITTGLDNLDGNGQDEAPISPVLSLTMSPSLLSTLPPELMPVSEGVESIDHAPPSDAQPDDAANAKSPTQSRAARRVKRIARLNAKAADAVKIAKPADAAAHSLHPEGTYVSIPSTAKDAVSVGDLEFALDQIWGGFCTEGQQASC
ncbi:hypothetical protein SYNPS1DRAFT_28828 [Syncephalis pseudoplumigaleata]|uniref:Uncharacterized protein n=1 Tax=Syncephalis pseudoplumigaleata TaxID=1712513 RepID=A0A4P9YZC6_9FUNG|nr:hypothetical protein SYNPS1DRAFT_28828 [Syncephalis pseudoplumigaleata]|eukprot:RKP25444.1 hypothetical protein SYNPS1DRAFT_28828 [Syncephalis pseudoplumigaleata]